MPQELLKILATSDKVSAGLTCFMHEVFWGESLPEQWKTCILTLLAKVGSPFNAGQLRPIALSSHI